MSDIGVSQEGYVATVEMRRPPHNFFSVELVAEIREAFERLDADPGCRAIVLAAEGRSFCAGADFSRRMETGTVPEAAAAAPASISTKKRSACSAQKAGYRRGAWRSSRRRAGPRVGRRFPGYLPGGALQRQFQPARLSSRLRPHRHSAAAGRRPAGGAAVLYRPPHSGDEAVRIGLADVLVPQAEVRSAAQALALEIAQSAPLAVISTRETLRRGLCDAIEAATERELVEQDWLRHTEDFKEGVKAMADRRLPDFKGH